MARARKPSPAKARSKAKEEPSSEPEGSATGAPRALWSGSLGFGLLQIPVSLHTATVGSDLRFHQLDDRDLSPVGYKRVNKVTGEEVEWEHIVRGYEIDKGEYVVISDEDLAAADVEATQTIDIVGFVDRERIEPIWFERPYYPAPGKRAERAYALFREALSRTNKVAVAKVVIRTRAHLSMVFPAGRALILELLRWSHEVRPPRALDLPGDIEDLKVSDRELEMAEELIARMSEDWEPSRYRDEYRDRVLEMIEQKARTGEVTEVRAGAAPRESPARASNVIELLRKSLERAPEGSEPARAPSKDRRRRSSAA